MLLLHSIAKWPVLVSPLAYFDEALPRDRQGKAREQPPGRSSPWHAEAETGPQPGPPSKS